MKLLLTLVCLIPSLAFSSALTTSVDIGSVGAAGSTSMANGVYTVRASGTDIGGTQDEFRFVHQALNGDGEITARVDSLTRTHPWSKAGVMIRETLSPNSRFAYTLIAAREVADFHYRLEPGSAAGPGGRSDHVSGMPYWVRLRRMGNEFTAYMSVDGENWRQQGESTMITMGASVSAGLAVTSHSNGALAEARFSNVTITPLSSEPEPPAEPPVANQPPEISGTPPTSATVGTQYAFTPDAVDPDGDALTYSISNRPSWLSFDSKSGRLQGTPTSANVGTFPNIVVGVTDGISTSQLPGFAIVVNTQPNSAPSISGTPASIVVQGSEYTFQPTASDADGDPLTFAVANAPSWASFDTTTGRLRGTPTESHLGSYSDISISVSDGTTTTSLAAFDITVQALALGSATLTWTPPTLNTDGSILTDLAGYKVHWGTAAGAYSDSATLNNAGVTTYLVENLAPGTYYFVVSAFNTAGAESEYSEAASKTIR